MALGLSPPEHQNEAPCLAVVVLAAAISWIEQQRDAYGRPWQITDSRTGTTTVHYDENGRRWKVRSNTVRTPGQSALG